MNYPFHRFSNKDTAFRKNSKIYLVFEDVFRCCFFVLRAERVSSISHVPDLAQGTLGTGIEPSRKPYLESRWEKKNFSALSWLLNKLQCFRFTACKVVASSNLFGGTKTSLGHASHATFKRFDNASFPEAYMSL